MFLNSSRLFLVPAAHAFMASEPSESDVESLFFMYFFQSLCSEVTTSSAKDPSRHTPEPNPIYKDAEMKGQLETESFRLGGKTYGGAFPIQIQ